LNAFGVVDASSVFLQSPTFDQNDYHSGEYEAQSIKILAVSPAGGECVHLSPVYCGSPHDKTRFNDSQVIWFLTRSRNDGLERNVVLVDLGHVIIHFPDDCLSR
jgi:hypothetical protein